MPQAHRDSPEWGRGMVPLIAAARPARMKMQVKHGSSGSTVVGIARRCESEVCLNTRANTSTTCLGHEKPRKFSSRSVHPQIYMYLGAVREIKSNSEQHCTECGTKRFVVISTSPSQGCMGAAMRETPTFNSRRASLASTTLLYIGASPWSGRCRHLINSPTFLEL